MADTHTDMELIDLQQFIHHIETSPKELMLATYKLQDKILPAQKFMHALKKAKENNTHITVMVEKYLTPQEIVQKSTDVKAGDSLEAYRTLDINIVSGAERFKASHYKLLITPEYAIIGTTNFDDESLPDDVVKRDFSVKIKDTEIIKEIRSVFEKDGRNEPVELAHYEVKTIAPQGTKLNFGPEQHVAHFLEMIHGATHSIDVYQQAMQDDQITEALSEAAKRGVKVRVLMSKFPFRVEHGNPSEGHQRKIVAGGGTVRLVGAPVLKDGHKLHIHAKVVIVDGDNEEKGLVYVGSANFFTPALKGDRQAGLISRNTKLIKTILHQFNEDWQQHEGHDLK